jgi:hypothetical protein
MSLIVWRRVAGPGVLTILGLGFVLVPLLRGEFFYYWDNAQQHYPQTVFLHDALRAGHIPHWWPEVGSGAPTVGEGQSAHFHPIRLLLTWMFSPPVSFMLEAGAYLAIAGVSMFFFLREFRLHRAACVIGGLCMMFNSFSVVFIRNIALHRSACLLPFAMLCAERFVQRGTYGALVAAGIVFGVQLLSGHPTFTIITVIATTTHLAARLWQRSRQSGQSPARAASVVTLGAAHWSIAVAAGAGVGAIQLLPQLMHVEHSVRQGGLNPEYATALAAQLRYLPQLILPYAFLQGDWLPVPDQWGSILNYTPSSGIYLGAAAVVLPLVAWWWRRRALDPVRPLAVGLVLAMTFAIGWNGVLFRLLGALPGLSGLRFPSRFLLWGGFCLAGLAALGLHRAIARGRLGALRTRDYTPLILGVAGSALLAAFFSIFRERLSTSVRLADDFGTGLGLSLLLIGIVAALVAAVLTKRLPPTLAVSLVVLFVAADLLGFRSRAGYAPTFSIADAHAEPSVARLIKSDREPFRVMSLISMERGWNRNEDLADYLQADSTSLWGIDSADVWFSLFLSRHYALRESIVWELNHSPEAAGRLSRFLGTWNVKYVVGPKGVTLPGWTPVHETERAAAWRNPHVLPRAYVVSEVVPEDIQPRPEWDERAAMRLELYRHMVVDWNSRRADAQIVDYLLNTDLDYRHTAIVEGPDVPELPSGSATFDVRELTHDSDSLAYEVDADRPGFLVISTSFYPGWTATVDGQPTRLYRTNYTSMGLVVPPGESQVLLEFATPGFRLGAYMTLVATILCALALSARRVRNRRWTPMPLPARGRPRS